MGAALRQRLAGVLFCCLVPAVASGTDTGLAPFLALYRLSVNGVPVGSTEVGLELAEGGYRYHAHTAPTGPLALFREDDILEESSGRILDGHPRPDSYRYLRSGSEIERSLSMEFDWERGRVHIRGQNDWSMAVPPEALDKLVQQLVFCRDLAAGRQQTSYRVADGGLLKSYVYQVLGTERVETPLGSYDALKASRSKDHGEADYTLWLAPALDHLPVRILRYRAGTSYLMELETLTPGRTEE